jgi:hypothetical protein
VTSGFMEVEAPSARPAAAHRTVSFSAALGALLLMLAVVTVRGRFDDPDMWWHLKTGQVIWTTHHIPTTDLFSYTTNHHSWIPHEWLSQLSIYAAYAARGFSGLMLWECFFTAAILLAGFYLCLLHSGNPKLAFLGALIIWFFGTIGFAVRPQMIGYLLLIVELILLHLGRTRNPRWFLALPPLFAVWVNAHGSFMLGLAVAALHLAASFARHDKGSLISARWSSNARRTLAVALAASLPVLLLNPVGIKLILYPVYTMFVPNIGVAEVSEWQPLAFQGSRSFGMLGLLACIIFLPVITHAKLFVHELLLLALATYLALSHQRLLFAFGILAAPIAARILSEVWQESPPQQRRPFADAALIVLSCVIAYVAFPSASALDEQVRRLSPVSAVEYIRSHHLRGPMLNEWIDGGYLVWALPEQPVFIDGRSDVYEWSGVLAEFARFATLAEPPNLLLDKYHVRFCLLGRHSPLATVIPLLPGWQPVYTDDVSIIFERTH